MLEDNNILKVSLFKELSFEYQHKKYNLENFLTKQLLNLLEILILKYSENVTSQYLMNTLWENSDNPKSSLKFHVFKLRKILKQIDGLEDIEFIVTVKGGYAFKPNLECKIDTYILQNQYIYIQNDRELNEDTLHYAEKINHIYKGTLKYDAEYLWFLQVEEYYHDIYLKTVHKLYQYYLEHKMNEKLKEVSLKAASIDPTVELNHIYYIQSLINLKEYSQAFDYYQKSTKMLIDVYALSLSDKMKELYDFLIEGIEEKQTINAITNYFKKKTTIHGAFYCEPSIFDYIYDMHLRSAQRTDIKYYLFIFEIQTKQDIEKQISKIKLVIQNSLRSSDVFTRVSKYQFIALLPCEDDQIGHMIAQRVTHNMRRKIKGNQAKVFYFIDKAISGEVERV